MRVSKKRDELIASRLIDLLTDTPSEIIDFERYIKSLADSEDTSLRKTYQIMEYDGLYRVLATGDSANRDSYGTLYVKDINEVVQNWVELCEKENIMFRLK